MRATRFTEERQRAETAAARHYDQLMDKAPWLHELHRDVKKIIEANASLRSKFAQLRELADRVAAELAPVAACKAGCAYCCHISVTVSQFEADLIGQAIGRTPARLTGLPDREAAVRDYYGKPCPFLAGNTCTIYAFRPLACRLHFSLADTPFLCNTEIPPEESTVPNLDLSALWNGYAWLLREHAAGDIREFFGETA